MREVYHEHLEAISGRLVAMCREVGDMIRAATQALLEADVQLADSVVAHDARVNDMQREIDEAILALIATQAPVAGELRRVIAGLRMTWDIERMGDLAAHVAKIARMRYPEHAVPAELRATFAAMGVAAEHMADRSGEVLRSRDAHAAAVMNREDDEMDRLHRTLFLVMFDDDWTGTVEAAVDLALLGRYYERFADHGVVIGSHVEYFVTGEYSREEELPMR